MKFSSLLGHVLELFEQIDNNAQPPDRLTAEFFRKRKYLGSYDRRFVSDTVFGMIRHRRLIEALLEQFISDHPDSELLNHRHDKYLPLYTIFAATAEKRSSAKIVEGLSSRWQMMFPNVNLDEFLKWIEQNTSLGFLPNEQHVWLGVRYSFQDWMVESFHQQFGDEAEQLLEALNQPAPVTLRVNLLKTTREKCQELLRQEGIETALTELSPVGLVAKKRFQSQSLQSFKNGLYEIQDEGSQLISLIASPKPGDVVIDACAGAGGKSLHLAELMKNEGEIIAIDVERKRLEELQTRALRAGITIIRTMLHGEAQPENFFGKADLVLVDAPCSGTGTIRRNPMLKWSVNEPLVRHYAEQQMKILEENSRFVKQGGKLVYATCSLLQQENEDVVNSFLEKHQNFTLQSSDDELEKLHSSFLTNTIALLPHRHQTDGFFVAIMKKEAYASVCHSELPPAAGSCFGI
jgi:16S rRNA (cytosine967-C5)-methyltransferase